MRQDEISYSRTYPGAPLLQQLRSCALAPAISVVARNMPGAGHIRAANYIYGQAPKDGTTIGTLLPVFVTSQVIDRTDAIGQLVQAFFQSVDPGFHAISIAGAAWWGPAEGPAEGWGGV